MSYNVPSPNEMVVDTDDYVDDTNMEEKDDVAIINPESLDADGEQLHDLPQATDHEAMREIIFTPLMDEPKVLEDVVNTWTVENWRSLQKKEHGPVFEAGGYPWRILLFPHGNNTDHCSIYLEHGFDANAVPDNWSCCVQFSLVLWNPNDPSLYVHHTAHHRFTKEEGDWGFTRFVEHRRMFNVPWEGSDRPLCENEKANISAYVRVVEDETGVLWHNFVNYDSKKETGYVGLKNQGATCYLNSLLQSLYFTNAFRKAIYQIPTENDESLDNSAYTLQRLFYQLQASDQAVSTSELTKSFGWETRHVFEQQDVQELSLKLMENMEKRMKGTKAENVLHDMFSGKIKTYISCINVDYESSRIEEFSDIQLTLAGKKDLLESFEHHIEVEKMEGENQYFAGDEHKLQDANKGVIFTSFPDVLHLQLKRFEYDFQRDMTMKINDRHEFPEVFDAAPFLNEDADMSEPWTYQLHGVLVHSGDLNAGHYYAFIKPEKDGWFYKYDDDKVTRATLREVLEENFGGEYRPRNGPAPMQKKVPIMRQNSAYMLVYIRQSRLDKILLPVTGNDVPQHLRQRVEEENAIKEARRREQREAHLYMVAKVATNETFREYSGTDMCKFDASDEEDPSAPKSYRLRRNMTIEEFIKQIAEENGQDPARMRLWLMVNRQNKTIRPDQPIMDLSPTIEEIYAKSAAHRDAYLRLWLEVASDVDANGAPVWPSFQPATETSPDVPSKEDQILLLLKYFDIEQQTMRGVGHAYLAKDKKIEDLIPSIRKAMSWGDSPTNEQLMLWEEIKPNMIEPLKLKFTLKMAELQDGDIVCFQKTPPRKDPTQQAEKDSVPKPADRLEDAREYYDFLEHKRTVRFHPHPTRCYEDDYPPFELVLNSKINYDVLSERVAAHLQVPATHIRLWTVNSASGNPKAPVRRGTNPTLRQILNPLNTNMVSNTPRVDAFFFEVLEMSLAELDTKKSIKVTWLPEGITKEENFDLLVPKTGTIEDIIQALIKKAKLGDEATDGKIRIYESSSHKFYREPSREHPVLNLSEYTQIFAERMPQEEVGAEENDFIHVFNFHSDVSRVHGIPFKFLLIQGEKFADTKKRLEKRTGLKGKSFEKIKFAVVRRANYSKPQYLEDDDELWEAAGSEDHFLGLDHLDRTRSLRNGGSDLFLR